MQLSAAFFGGGFTPPTGGPLSSSSSASSAAPSARFRGQVGSRVLLDRVQNVRTLLSESYRVDVSKILGEGTFGCVYEGTDLETGAPVAVKKIQKSALFSAGEREALVTEVRTQRSAAGHPGIVPLLAVFESDTDIDLVMPLVYRRTLHQQLGRAAYVPEELGKRVTRELLCAVAHLHARGIVHGDVKPRNILVSPSVKARIYGTPAAAASSPSPAASSSSSPSSSSGGGEFANKVEKAQKDSSSADGSAASSEGSKKDSHALVLLCDFGTAAEVAGAKGMVKYTGVVGTGAFIAPEVLDGRDYSARADIWSVGVVLHRMLFGTKPFVGGSGSIELIGDDEDGPTVSADARDLLVRMLTPNPQNRISAAEALKHRWLGGENAPANCDPNGGEAKQSSAGLVLRSSSPSSKAFSPSTSPAKAGRWSPLSAASGSTPQRTGRKRVMSSTGARRALLPETLPEECETKGGKSPSLDSESASPPPNLA